MAGAVVPAVPGTSRVVVPAARGVDWRRALPIAIVLAYMGVLVAAPLIALVWSTLGGGLGPILRALASRDLLLAFWRTLYIAVIAVAIHAVFGTMVAWTLVRHEFRGRGLLNGLIDLPFAVSPVVAGFMLFLLFGRRSPLAPVLEALGIKVAFAVPGMILATAFVTLPFMIRELMPLLRTLGTEQEEAAATCGASGWQTFWRVTLPALRWGFIYGMTLTFARALGEFGAVLVVGGALQGRTETATLFIFRSLEERQYPEAYTAAVILGVASILILLGTEVLRARDRTISTS